PPRHLHVERATATCRDLEPARGELHELATGSHRELPGARAGQLDLERERAGAALEDVLRAADLDPERAGRCDRRLGREDLDRGRLEDGADQARSQAGAGAPTAAGAAGGIARAGAV